MVNVKVTRRTFTLKKLIAASQLPESPTVAAAVTDGGTPESAHKFEPLPVDKPASSNGLDDTDDEKLPVIPRKRRGDLFLDDEDMKEAPKNVHEEIEISSDEEEEFLGLDQDELEKNRANGRHDDENVEDSTIEADYFKGNMSKVSGIGGRTRGNGRSGYPVFCVIPNVKIMQVCVVHAFLVCGGFDEIGNPLPCFHGHVNCLAIKDEENNFFTSKNIVGENVVAAVDNHGVIISVPGKTGKGEAIAKHVPIVLMYTRFTLTPERLETTMTSWLNILNKSTWSNRVLNQRVQLLTPEHVLSAPDGLGTFIGKEGVEKICNRAFGDFNAGVMWGKDKTEFLQFMWKPGTWTVENAKHFGASTKWLSAAELAEYKVEYRTTKKTKTDNNESVKKNDEVDQEPVAF
jgi:hypothetical protein